MARGFLVLLMAFVAAACATLTPAPRVDKTLVRDAFHLGFPVYEMARVRHEFVERLTARGVPAINRFAHRKTLSDHNDRVVTTPNNDTLYSAAWLDLSGGPVTIFVPETGERYLSIALMDMFTDHFAYSGTRTSGGRAEKLFVVGPDWRGNAPSGARMARAPTNDVWAISRLLVDGPADLPAATAIQDRIRIDPPAPGEGTAFVARPPLRPNPAQFLDVVNEALARSPVSPVHADRIARLRAVGIRPGAANAWAQLSPSVQAMWTTNWDSLNNGLRGGLDTHVTRHDGWSYPLPGLGNFGQNDAYRAAIALEGLAALEPDEAMYMFTRTTADGASLDGARNSYRIRLPSDIPVKGFWSLTMYEETDDRLFFVANPIRRYAIGNRTPGLRRNPDGTINILIQHVRPVGEAATNWLPAPRGPFRLSFRAYLPGPALREGRFRLPGVQSVQAQ
ncbi:MAG TPA: DUF1254 domain-containing protein [Sphingomonadaceae bacterium]|nr:DUF1254 domain-containing protein [Sphingomonadaceae bacterium]